MSDWESCRRRLAALFLSPVPAEKLATEAAAAVRRFLEDADAAARAALKAHLEHERERHVARAASSTFAAPARRLGIIKAALAALEA